MQMPYFDIDTSPLRPGQRQAVDTICDRVRQKLSHTACVLPMRYGKSDVIRVAGLGLWRDRLVSHVLVITPSEVLRDQFADPEACAESFKRYSIPFSEIIPVYIVDRSPRLPFPPSTAIFAVATTQMANVNKKTLVDWVESEIRRYEVPPIIFIDECETTSDKNEWGDCVEVLAKAGAFVVLLTATPFRTDRKRIPGFEDILIPEATSPVKVYRKRRDEQGEELIDIYEGEKEVFRLAAHHITSFRQAWDEGTEDNPSPLCTVNRQPFDYDLTKLNLSSDIRGQVKISELSASDSRRSLMQILRDPGVISYACGLFVETISWWRRFAPDTVGIVYVGNDEPGDSDVNKHARDVKRAILKCNPSLNIIIATASDGKEAAAMVKAFRRDKGWVGDVLIVKQMGGRGLDIPRLKVCLDLSNVRAAGPMIQRIGRVLTLWKRGPHPKDWVRFADYICPCDINGQAIFQRFILDEGGEASVSRLEYLETITPGPQEKEAPPIYLPDVPSMPQSFNDSDNIEASGEMIPELTWFYQQLPGLKLVCSAPVFANVLEENSRREGAAARGETRIRNVNDEEDDWVARCNLSADKLINTIVKDNLGRSYRSGDKESGQMHTRVSIAVWSRHKQGVGVNPKTDVRDIHDIPTLQRMRENMEREFYEQRATHSAR
jgi:superfamily II DNA or RNA helicase